MIFEGGLDVGKSFRHFSNQQSQIKGFSRTWLSRPAAVRAGGVPPPGHCNDKDRSDQAHIQLHNPWCSSQASVKTTSLRRIAEYLLRHPFSLQKIFKSTIRYQQSSIGNPHHPAAAQAALRHRDLRAYRTTLADDQGMDPR